MSSGQRTSRSLTTMVFASLVSAVAGIVLTFWVPRLISVDDFGRWRTYMLYMGYAGLLHMGLVDGALLLLSRDPVHRHPGLSVLDRMLRFVAIEHLLLVAMAVALLFWPAAHAFAPVFVAFAVYALFFNLVGVLQVYMQSQFRFVPVALGMSGPSALFVLCIVGISFWHTTVNQLLLGFFVSWAVTLCVLLVVVRRVRSASGESVATTEDRTDATFSAWQLGLTYIAAGWPIVLANAGFALMQSADRVTVNLTRPIHDFAIYSLSQSTIYVPITILAAVSRVAFSHFARVSDEGFAGIYRSSTRALTMIWMLLLPYYFAVEYVVRRFLPKYVPGLAAGRVLLLSVLFLSLIQIVQLNTYSLEGRQRQFFAGSLVAVVIAFATAWTGSRIFGTLTAVAWSQVVTAALWWMGNEFFLRRRTGIRWFDIARVVVGFGLSAGVLIGIQSLHRDMALDVALYLAVILPVCVVLFRHEAILAVEEIVTRARLRQ